MDMFTKSALSTLLCLLLLMINSAQAEDFIDELDLEEAVRIAEEELYQHQHQLSKTNQSLQQQEEKLQTTQEKEQKLLRELADINIKIINESELLIKLYNEMQSQKSKTLEKKEILEATSSEKQTLALLTEKRLAAYYRMGKIGVMNITFSSSSLPELVHFHEYYRYMLRQDRELIQTFRVKLIELHRARQGHIEEAKRLEIALEETKKQQIVLEDIKKERSQVIEQIQIEKSLYEEATVQLEQSAQALIHKIEELKEETKQVKQEKEEWMIATYPIEPHKKRRPSWLRGIGGYQKQLPPPTMGAVTKLFTGNTITSKKVSYGINFRIAPEAKVRAVFKGKVVHIGYVKGYGQLIIISHSGGYYTLTSSVSNITVKKDAIVEQGDELGFMSQHNSQLQQDLHFEIRLKETPLDPLAWLDPNYIIFSPNLEAHQ